MFLFLFLFEFSKNCFIPRYLEEAFPSHTNVSVMINQTHNLYGIDRQNTTMNKTSLFQELRKAAARTKRKNRKKTPKKRPKATTTTTTPIAQSLYVTVPLMYKELSAFSKAFQNDVNAIDWSLLGPSSPLSESMYVHPFVLRQVATATAPHVLLPHMAVPTFSKCFQNCSLTHHIIFSKPTTTNAPPHPPRYNLWLGQQGITASMHYDAVFNFFYQLHGIKLFYLASPLHYLQMKPYPTVSVINFLECSLSCLTSHTHTV